MNKNTKEEVKRCDCPSDLDGFCLKCKKNCRHSCICHIPVEKEEKCFCPSYFDDDNVLQNCKCGKCVFDYKKEKLELSTEAGLRNEIYQRLKYLLAGNYTGAEWYAILDKVELIIKEQKEEEKERILTIIKQGWSSDELLDLINKSNE